MRSPFNDDFRNFILALNTAEVKYMVVGAFSVILHGYFRSTGDLDVWVKPDVENYARLSVAFAQFGLPISLIEQQDFLNTQETVIFSFGVPPVAIDIMTKVKGLEFDQAFEGAQWFDVGFPVRALAKSDLIAAKQASGRFKDLEDIRQIMT